VQVATGIRWSDPTKMNTWLLAVLMSQLPTFGEKSVRAVMNTSKSVDVLQLPPAALKLMVVRLEAMYCWHWVWFVVVRSVKSEHAAFPTHTVGLPDTPASRHME